MKKLFKDLGLGLLALALVVGMGTNSAEAALTLDATTVTGSTTVSIVSTTSSAASFDSGTTGAVNLGTGAAAKAVTVGSTTTTASTTIQSGTGDLTLTTTDDFSLNGVAASDYTVGAATTTGTITIGGTAQTGTITIGSSSGDGIIDIGAGAGVTTIQLGVSDGADVITVGDANASVAITDPQWSVTSPGVATFVNALVTAHADTGLDTAAAGALSIGNTTATSVSICNDSPNCDSVLIATEADGGTITIGNASNASVSITDDNWSVTAAGVATFVSETVNGAITLANGETLANGTNATFTFGNNADTDVTLVASDSSGATNLIIDTTTTGAITIGSADVASFTVIADGTTDGDVVLPLTSISGAEMVNNTVTETQLSATLTFADGDYVNMAAANQSTTLEGLRLPQATDCATNGTVEGVICWDTDDNVLRVGDGAASAAVAGSTSAVNTWTDNQIFTFVGDEDIALGSTAATITTGVLGLTVAAGDAAVDGLNISLTQNDGATAAVDATATEILLTGNDADGDMFGLRITGASTANSAAGTYEAGIFIDNADTTAASMTDGIIITSSGVNLGVTDAIDVSAANILNAINIGANSIQTGTGGTVTFARSDAGIVTLTAIDDDATAALTLDAGGAAAIVIGSADVTTFTVTTDGTGTGEVVLPLTSIGSPELTAGAKTNTVVIPVPDPGGANSDISAGYVLWTPSVNVTITKIYTAAETAWVAAAAANDATVTVTNAAVGTVAALNVVTALGVGTNTDMGAITNGAVVAGTNVTLTVTTNGTADAPRQNLQIEYTTTD